MKKKRSAPRKDKSEIRELSETVLDLSEFIREHVATKGDIAELSDRVTSLEKGQKEILDTLEPLSRAHDKDSVIIVDHERRMVRLGKHVGV